jgi:SAM-dependent methyltransferase
MTKEFKLPPEIIRHYQKGVEKNRLSRGGGYLEMIRTQEIMTRYLPKHPVDILDVGGGPGIYSRWLAELGHHVSLVDAVPSHIKQARANSRGDSDKAFNAKLGDARRLDWAPRSFDIVLMLGPLYHLTKRQDRIRSLKEVHRVLRPKGLLFAAAISKYASLVDGLKYGYLNDPIFRRIVERDLKEGQHRNPTNAKGYFTTAFSHHPRELRQELNESGFKLKGILALEGVAGLLHANELDKELKNEESRNRLLGFMSRVEEEPSLVGFSSHMLAVATAN